MFVQQASKRKPRGTRVKAAYNHGKEMTNVRTSLHYYYYDMIRYDKGILSMR